MPVLGFESHGFQNQFSSSKGMNMTSKLKKRQNVPFSKRNLYFKSFVLLHLLNNLFKIHGFPNPPSPKFHGFRGTHGTHSNTDTELKSCNDND